MRVEEIQEIIARRPFQPFRLEYSNGTYDDVRHPDLLQVARRLLSIAVYKDEDDMPNHFVWCDPVHVVRITPINGALADPA